MRNKVLLGLSILLIVIVIIFAINMLGNSEASFEATYLTEELDSPHSVVFDSSGNMYVADTVKLLRVTKDGSINEFAKFTDRCMTAIIDKHDNVFAATSHRVFKITPDGDMSLFADGFTRADGFEQDLEGNIYVADAFKDIIYKITPEGEKSIFIESKVKKIQPSTYYVTGLLFDKDFKKLYTVRHSDNTIMVYNINEDGSCSEGEKYCSLGLARGADYVVMDENDNLYVTSFYGNRVLKVDKNKNVTKVSIKGAKLSAPTGIAFGKAPFNEESIYIANYKGKSIVEVNLGVKAAVKVID